MYLFKINNSTFLNCWTKVYKMKMLWFTKYWIVKLARNIFRNPFTSGGGCLPPQLQCLCLVTPSTSSSAALTYNPGTPLQINPRTPRTTEATNKRTRLSLKHDRYLLLINHAACFHPTCFLYNGFVSVLFLSAP